MLLYVHPQCAKQNGVVESGYYIMRFMCDMILSRSTSIVNVVSTKILELSSCHLFWIKLILNHFIVHIWKVYLVHTRKMASMKLDQNGRSSFLSTYIVLSVRFFINFFNVFCGSFFFWTQTTQCKCLKPQFLTNWSNIEISSWFLSHIYMYVFSLKLNRYECVCIYFFLRKRPIFLK